MTESQETTIELIDEVLSGKATSFNETGNNYTLEVYPDRCCLYGCEDFGPNQKKLWINTQELKQLAIEYLKEEKIYIELKKLGKEKLSPYYVKVGDDIGTPSFA